MKGFSRSEQRVGIELASDHLNIVARNIKTQHVLAAASLALDEPREKGESLAHQVAHFVEQHALKNAECHFVLSSRDYQLLLVERPEVPDTELRQAIKWKVKDLIQAPLDSVVLDTFALPKDASKGKDMLYVVVVALDKIKQCIQAINDAHLKLTVIDIEVLALRNLLALKNMERAVALVRLVENGGDVSIFRDDQLYLSRRFSLNYSGGLLDELPASDLALEVQRSFDYFERQMGQVPPATLFICGEGVGPEKISDELKRSISAQVEYLNLENELSLAESSGAELDEGILQLCLAALGTTFRSEAA